MKILIDGDACNVIKITEKIASGYNIECHIYCDTAHIITSDYSYIHIVDKGPDSADFAIVKNCCKGDIIITNDSGLAALILARQGHAVNPYGIEYTNRNIMSYLTQRFVRNDAKRRSNRNQVKGCNAHHDKQQKPNYASSLIKIIKKVRKDFSECQKENDTSLTPTASCSCTNGTLTQAKTRYG